MCHYKFISTSHRLDFLLQKFNKTVHLLKKKKKKKAETHPSLTGRKQFGTGLKLVTFPIFWILISVSYCNLILFYFDLLSTWFFFVSLPIYFIFKIKKDSIYLFVLFFVHT